MCGEAQEEDGVPENWPRGDQEPYFLLLALALSRESLLSGDFWLMGSPGQNSKQFLFLTPPPLFFKGTVLVIVEYSKTNGELEREGRAATVE